MDGVRAADVVLVILGERYGERQSSGKSATHEEFDEAGRNKTVFVFVQSGVTPDPRQAEFIAEARAWDTGKLTSEFTDPDDLRDQVTRALHRWQLANAAGPVDAEEMEARALATLPESDRNRSGRGALLAISVVGAPHQTILRPTEIEAPGLIHELAKQASYGEASIFDRHQGVDDEIENHALVLRQENGYLRLGEDGSPLLVLPLSHSERRGADDTIEEDVTETLHDALRFSAQVLDYIDRTERLTSVATAVGILNPGYGEWKTRAEHDRRRDGAQTMRMWDDTPVRAVLQPAHRTRSAFQQQPEVMAEDLMVLLRRFFQQRR